MKNTKVVLCLIGVYSIFKVDITNYIGRCTRRSGGGAKYDWVVSLGMLHFEFVRPTKLPFNNEGDT